MAEPINSKKKLLWIKIVAIVVALIPPLVVFIINAPIFISRADKTISVAAIFVIIVIICVFKDAFRRFVSTPSAFKTSLVVFILSAISLSIGQQLFYISLAALIGGLCALPFNIWYNHLTRPPTKDEMMDGFKDIIKEKDSNNEKSNEHD